MDTVKKGRGGDREDQQGRPRRPVGGMKRTNGGDKEDSWGGGHWVRKRRGSVGDRTDLRGNGWDLNDSVDGEETAAGLSSQILLITGCCGIVWRNSSLLTPYDTPLLTDTFRLAKV